MKRHVLIFGVVGGALVTLLQWTQYRFLVVEHSVEIYAALIAAIFAGVGVWLGIRLTRRAGPQTDSELAGQRVRQLSGGAGTQSLSAAEQSQDAQSGARLNPDLEAGPKRRDDLGVTPRELEILALVAEGLSNREIAERLFVSENTVKTHCSRAFDKLGARRRTQAVQLGKEFGLLP
jgi:DNA-binding CsgD family transcriptional regulator